MFILGNSFSSNFVLSINTNDGVKCIIPTIIIIKYADDTSIQALITTENDY